MKYIKLFENFDYFSYNGEDKTITGVYKILKSDDKVTTLENIQELAQYTGMQPFGGVIGKGSRISYFDKMLAGVTVKRVIDLPTKNIKIGDKVDDLFNEVTIPYWLYKKNIISLKIKKLDKELYRLREWTGKPEQVTILDKYI